MRSLTNLWFDPSLLPWREVGRRLSIERPSRRVIALVLFITVGSAIDALCTLLSFGDGVREVNPLMALLLTYVPTTFVSLKMGITCAAVWTIAALHQCLPASAYLGLHGLALSSLALIGHHAVRWW